MARILINSIKSSLFDIAGTSKSGHQELKKLHLFLLLSFHGLYCSLRKFENNLICLIYPDSLFIFMILANIEF